MDSSAGLNSSYEMQDLSSIMVEDVQGDRISSVASQNHISDIGRSVSREAPQSKYNYIPLPDFDHIRVLTLRPAQLPAAPLMCTLTAAPLSTARYEALSYTWAMCLSGDDSKCRLIDLDGFSFAVTQNLEESLRRMRPKDVERHLWIDAVCINQEDIAERNAQVSRMAQIYRRATRVSIWLGETAGQASAAAYYDTQSMEFLAQIDTHFARDCKTTKQFIGESKVHYFGNLNPSCLLAALASPFGGSSPLACACSESNKWKEHDLQHLVSDHPFDSTGDLGADSKKQYLDRVLPQGPMRLEAFWRAYSVMHLFLRRYWTRRWIVQEIYHSKSLALHFGPYCYDMRTNLWEWLHEFASILQHLATTCNISLDSSGAGQDAALVSRCRDLA
jgi:hypothetical protein